ncbi:MAG: hypothetical protein R6U55_05305 [Desulfovermiculus sp.]
MNQLTDFRFLPIDWDMTPEEAVTMYLEWGNNWRKGERPPVRSKHDESYYFVVNTWEEKPRISLLRRNSEHVEELVNLAVPKSLEENVRKEMGNLRGVHPITPEIRHWLEQEM